MLTAGGDPKDPARDGVETCLDALRLRIDRNPADVEARRGLAAALLDLDRPREAANELRAASDLAPDAAPIHADLAAVLADLAAAGHRGAEREAWERAERALELQPDLDAGLLVKARLLVARGDWQAAVAAVRPALAMAGDGLPRRIVDLLLGRANLLASRGEWLEAEPLWREAAAIDPGLVRPPLLSLLREEQDVLLAPPRWSWLVYPPPPDRERTLRWAAAAFVAAVACLLAFVVLASRDETLLLSLVPCLGIVAAPAAVVLAGRRRRRAFAAPHAELVAAIQADPAAFFRGAPPIATMLAALVFVAAERQGKALAETHPYLVGRGSPMERQARRGALLRAPWMPRSRD